MQSMNNMATQMELFEPVKKGLKDGSLVTTASPSDQLLIDFNAIAADYNESRDITGTKRAITGQEMMSIFDALIGDKMQLSPVKMQEGGLLDEGGTKDPVSGNDVPPGSMQEEVRDDIPAQLSEGEFVFPADVVRFIGLEKLMKIRQRAKAGLKMMEEMGQMGNSEEAIIPDDLPFSIDDLDMEDDGLEMAQGGVVSMSNGGNITPMPGGSPGGPIGSFNPRIPGQMGMNPNIGTAPAPMQAASSGGVDPNLGGTKFTGTAIQPITMPFQEAKGPGVINVEEKNVVYVNEAGQERTFIVKADGIVIDPATGQEVNPETLGFKVKTDTPKTQTATGTGVQTAKVVDDGDGGAGDEGIQSTASVTLGGISGTGRQKGLRVGDYKTFGVSYNVPGGLPGMAGAFSTVAGLAFGKGLPENATATIFDRDFPKASITVSAKDFNAMKALDYKGELAEAYKDALNITAGVLDNKVTINENGQIVDGKGNPVSDRTQGLVQRAVVGSVLDNVKTSVPGFLDSINNFGKVSFEEAVANANDAQRSVLDNMGVDYDPSLEVTAEEKADMARQEEKALAEALARANQARENKAAADRAARSRIDYDILQSQMRDAFEASDGQDDNVGAGADVGTGGEEDVSAGPSGPSGSQSEVDDFQSDLG